MSCLLFPLYLFFKSFHQKRMQGAPPPQKKKTKQNKTKQKQNKPKQKTKQKQKKVGQNWWIVEVVTPSPLIFGSLHLPHTSHTPHPPSPIFCRPKWCTCNTGAYYNRIYPPHTHPHANINAPTLHQRKVSCISEKSLNWTSVVCRPKLPPFLGQSASAMYSTKHAILLTKSICMFR